MASDARFDWLVGNMSVHQENLFQSRIFVHLFPSFVELSLRTFFRVSIASFKQSGKLGEFSTVMKTNFPSCLDEAMETRKTPSIA